MGCNPLPPPEQNFFITIEMKLWPKEQNFKSKSHPTVPSGHAQMTQFETWSDFTDQFFVLCMSPRQKKLINGFIFNF